MYCSNISTNFELHLAKIFRVRVVTDFIRFGASRLLPVIVCCANQDFITCQ